MKETALLIGAVVALFIVNDRVYRLF